MDAYGAGGQWSVVYPILKEGVNERCEGRALRQDDQQAQEHEDDEDGGEPEFFPDT